MADDDFANALARKYADMHSAGDLRNGLAGDPSIPPPTPYEGAMEQARGLQRHIPDFDPVEVALAMATGPRVRLPARTGKFGSLPEEASFRKLMGQEYERAHATGDISTQYDMLGGRLINDRSMPAAMRQTMELERARLAHEMGAEGRRAAGIGEIIE